MSNDINETFMGALLGLFSGVFFILWFGEEMGLLASFSYGILVLILMIFGIKYGRYKK